MRIRPDNLSVSPFFHFTFFACNYIICFALKHLIKVLLQKRRERINGRMKIDFLHKAILSKLIEIELLRPSLIVST